MTGNFSVKAALTNSANYLVAAIYDPSTSTPTWLESQAPIKSGTFPYYPPSWPVTFLTNLTSGKTYLIIIWECASNTTTSAPVGTIIVYGTFEPSANTTTVRSDLYLTYGTSTGFTNNTTYVDTTLEGWGISVENIGYGTLKPGTDYTFDSTTGTIVFATPLNTGPKYCNPFFATSIKHFANFISIFIGRDNNSKPVIDFIGFEQSYLCPICYFFNQPPIAAVKHCDGLSIPLYFFKWRFSYQCNFPMLGQR